MSETIFIKTYLVHMQIMMIVDLMIYAIFMIHKSEFFFSSFLSENIAIHEIS